MVESSREAPGSRVMLFHLYEVGCTFFILQGLALPVLTVVAFFLTRQQNKKVIAPTAADSSQRPTTYLLDDPAVMLRGMPKLAPLSCAKCHRGLLIAPAGTYCPACHDRGSLPEGYAEVTSLQPMLRQMLKRALRDLRLAKFLTSVATGRVFAVMLWVEPVLLIGCTVGNYAYASRDTWLSRLSDKLVDTMGHSVGYDTMRGLMFDVAVLGMVSWLIIFVLLFVFKGANVDGRKALSQVPDPGSAPDHNEIADCQTCQGKIVYAPGEIACLCHYCHEANFRGQPVVRPETVPVIVARKKRKRQPPQEASGPSTQLFVGLDVVTDFTVPLLIAVVIVILCAIVAPFLATKPTYTRFQSH